MAVNGDSAKPLLDEIVSSLRRLEEILAYVGIFYVGKLTLPTFWELLKGLKTHFLSRLIAPRLVEKYGKWAVVTGSTEGVGKAYAFELARNGMNIVLISGTIKDLENVALEISQEFGVETEVVQANFINGRRIYENIARSLSQKDIGILVNSIGVVSKNLMLEDVPEDDLWDMVNVNVGAAPAMTKIVLPGMVRRKRGAIINISALGAFVPLPYKQMCMATKAFVDSYSQALEYEYRSSGIVVQTVLPGQVCEPSKKSCSPYLFTPSPSRYAYHALSTLGHSPHTTGYWAHGVLAWFFKRIPESMLMWSYALVHKPAICEKKVD